MLITRIDLENIKSYRNVHMDLGRGTTAISGSNGAGKTTIVEAIGFALFDYLPYKQTQFIREGDKFGKVVVHLLGNDDRPYEIERRVGTGAHWFVYDVEADARLEQSQDVKDKLHDLFGIDRDRPLDSLFRDALGVPQGTFTAVFLQTAAERKKTFDALLQIEDYKTAAKNLLETQHYYKDQINAQEREIERLEWLTRDLEVWKQQLHEARLLDEQQKRQNIQQLQQRQEYEQRKVELKAQDERVKDLKSCYDASLKELQHARIMLSDREAQLQDARKAWYVVEQSRAAYQQYEQAAHLLRELRLRAQHRDTLREQQATFQQDLGQTAERIKSCQRELDKVAVARQQIVELASLVEQQAVLDKERDAAIQRAEQYKAVGEQGRRFKEQQTQHRKKQEVLQSRIAEIEPLKPLAELLQERLAMYSGLQARLEGKPQKDAQLKQYRGHLRKLQIEQDNIENRSRSLQQQIAAIESHRQEAEELPALQARSIALSAQQQRLVGSIGAYVDARAQSIGGQCPFLRESCLNIKQRGVMSLESYFDNLLAQENEQLAQVERDLTVVIKQCEQIQKYADDLGKLKHYTDSLEVQHEQLQRQQQELQRVEEMTDALVAELETIKRIELQMKTLEADLSASRDAEQKVRQLDGLQRQHQQLEEQINQLEDALQELRREHESLRGSKEEQEAIETRLQALDDPRGKTRQRLEIVAQEGHFTQQLQAETQHQQGIFSQLQTVQEQMAAYSTLDTEIKQQEQLQQQCFEPHRQYIANQNEASLLPEREQNHQKSVTAVQTNEAALQRAERAYNEAKAGFDEHELTAVEQEITRLNDALTGLIKDMEANQKKITQLQEEISKAEAFMVDLEAAQHELQTLRDLLAMLESFRKLMTEAVPYILKAMLDNISAEANRIFGEIMGDRSAQLSWQNDYEVTLRRQGVSRTFAQLSGGEQMSAALAVRLALLKKLSSLNVAFFDEPTQNMDELRRMNLAEQIRRVRGFDQLIVISHDDTFEQGLDGLVRLQKENGETRLLSEDEIMEARRNQFTVSAL